MNDSPKNLIHKNERKYFIIALVFSIGTYISLISSLIGIVYLGLFLAISLLLHALMLGYIRTNGVRLNPEQFPEVYDKIKELCAKMEMKSIPEVYVLESSGALNAFATRFFGRNMVVLYSAIFELIEEGAEDELSFVIAHELAHIKRRHISTQLMVLPAMWIPGVTQAYSRACEYTCDRFAAFYTGNSEAAKNCLTMFSVGKMLSKRVNRTSYLNQVNEEKGFIIWLSEILSTHPPLPKRIREIGLFMGDDENAIAANRSSKKIWFGISAVTLLFALIIGGSMFALKKLDIESLMNEVEINSNLDSTPPLIDAVIDGDRQKLNNLLNAGEPLDTQDYNGWTALHWAVKASDIEASKALIGKGADPNIEDYYGVVPLMMAAGDGHIEIVQSLLETGADIDHQDYNGWTPLIYAVSSGQNEIAQALLDAGANTDVKDYEDSTALKHAIKQGNQETVTLLRNYN
ncbi:M48 family metallopeptidase [Paenibacillus alkaliterrae]|uniref:M48 family metallopeptidase n=1 Tax=Paenibacillus alkaliterrae TaxID=320909 RepID=UPI001F26975A|nr:M48 family metallopeptidase [Paenibacillus alkaliterrae]MCF2937735.1 M48 family metallopeptidase [Paenibacillus alkaliterrae]